MNKHAESPGTGPVARVLVSLICLFCMGCGGDSKFDDGSVATGTLSVTHQLERGVPDRVDGFHYACLDADGNTVMEFSLKEKASEHLLENVPVTCRVLYTTYYDRVDGAALTEQASEAVGDSKAPVEVQAGKRSKVAIIGDPTAKVYITGSNGQYTLEVDDNAFFMQGVGGDYSSAEYAYTYLNDTLQNSHVNTIRTYGVGDSGVTITAAQAALAQAKALTKDDTRPVMVIVGLDLNDAADPRTYARAVFNGLIGDPNADHILAWCISNEWVSLTDATDPNNATVDAVSKWIQQQTPRTLTMAAIQHPSEGSLNIITTSMPTLDFIGINSFYGSFNADWAGGGFLNLLSGYISELGKPWCLTEYYSYDLPSEPFGDYKGMPRQTLNGSTDYYLELNSTSNARNYADVWNDYVVGNQPNGCLGGCALNWGPPHNSQCNAFWKQMFTYGGQWELYVDWYAKYGVRRLQCVDAVIGAYGGTPDAAACPGIVLPADKDPSRHRLRFQGGPEFRRKVRVHG